MSRVLIWMIWWYSKHIKKYNPILVASSQLRILRSLKVDPSDVVQSIESLGYTCFDGDGRTTYLYASNEVICEKINA